MQAGSGLSARLGRRSVHPSVCPARFTFETEEYSPDDPTEHQFITVLVVEWLTTFRANNELKPPNENEKQDYCCDSNRNGNVGHVRLGTN